MVVEVLIDPRRVERHFHDFRLGCLDFAHGLKLDLDSADVPTAATFVKLFVFLFEFVAQCFARLILCVGVPQKDTNSLCAFLSPKFLLR
jgi:hypothetical protein